MFLHRLSPLLLSYGILISAAPVHATTINLGTAQSYAVLAGSAITNTGLTNVLGDVGVAPGTAITGFPPGVFSGTLHAGDASAIQAESDLTTAYTVAAGLACGTDLTGQGLGGLTLTPGVYCFNSAAQLTGTLTLDTQGDPNAVFLIQIASTLTAASNSAVQFAPGDFSNSVFWQVGTSATLGTGSNFEGNILANTSITLTTGANLGGRALAISGAVTLDTNNVNPSNTPEPASAALFGTALAALIVLSRKANRTSAV